MADEELDAFRARFPEAAERAFEQYDELEAHAGRLDALSSERAAELPNKPILTIVVCLSCGASEAIRASRPWPVDRAMARSGLSERDVLDVVALLRAAFDAGPELEELDGELLRELKALVALAPEPEEVREVCGVPSSEVRTTRAGMLREMERRGMKFPR